MKLFWLIASATMLIISVGFLFGGDRLNSAWCLALGALAYAFYLDDKKKDK